MKRVLITLTASASINIGAQYPMLSVGRGTALQARRSPVRFAIGSFVFIIDLILPVAQWQRGESASNRNEYQEYFMCGKGGRCVRP
jgi:hypothetical protein